MATAPSGASDLTGTQSEARTAGLAVRIDYESPRYEYFKRTKGNDWLFSLALPENQLEPVELIGGHPDEAELRAARLAQLDPTWREFDACQFGTKMHFDPYAVRGRFFAVDSPNAAVEFLSGAGTFWPWVSVLWSQFREWQEFLNWLRLDPQKAGRNPEGKKAWKTAAGIWPMEKSRNQFFKSDDLEFIGDRWHDPDLTPEEWRNIRVRDAQELFALRGFALTLKGWDLKQRVSLCWYEPGRKPEKWEARRETACKSAGYVPFLRIEATSILEAIAATIYADAVYGVKTETCKMCRKIFERKSDHGQEFCPPPDHLKSSPCKNAYFQEKRRKALKKTKKQEKTPRKG